MICLICWYIYINSDINIDQFWRKTKFSCFWMKYVWYPKDYRCCFVIEIIVERQCSHTILLSIASKSQEHHLFPLGSHSIRSLSDLYPLKSLEKSHFPNGFPSSQWIPMASGPGDRPRGSQLLRVAGVHSFPVTGLFDDPFELLHLFRPEPKEREPRPRPMWQGFQMDR